MNARERFPLTAQIVLVLPADSELVQALDLIDAQQATIEDMRQAFCAVFSASRFTAPGTSYYPEQLVLLAAEFVASAGRASDGGDL